MRQGSSVLDAAAKGLEGAVRHFLQEDPRCVKTVEKFGGEAWVAGGGLSGLLSKWNRE